MNMTPEHKKYLNYNENEFTSWGCSVGEHTASVVRYFLTSGKETEQGYKACASMTKLADRYGAARLENACERLLAFTSTPSIRTLSTILKNGQDKVAAPKEPEVPKADTQHGITRGAAYFRRGGGGKRKRRILNKHETVGFRKVGPALHCLPLSYSRFFTDGSRLRVCACEASDIRI